MQGEIPENLFLLSLEERSGRRNVKLGGQLLQTIRSRMESDTIWTAFEFPFGELLIYHHLWLEAGGGGRKAEQLPQGCGSEGPRGTADWKLDARPAEPNGSSCQPSQFIPRRSSLRTFNWVKTPKLGPWSSSSRERSSGATVESALTP